MSSPHNMYYCRICCSPINYRNCAPFLSHSTMATRRKWSSSADATVAATTNRRMLNNITDEVLQPSDICAYCPANHSFHLVSVLLRRLFSPNDDRTKFVSVRFYPLVTIKAWWNSAPSGGAGRSSSFSATSSSTRW